ncbi:hypothetical protein VO63_18975 [Streptomyces showdoensis]|uniref:Uncharacterized protein n=1 Tax=Streptomyces showdoensis TaxID=68268 RepID=A0A2P2GLD2_STREW|nr:hypothetical protein VO63_18975 [Streptomyces showdoensis]
MAIVTRQEREAAVRAWLLLSTAGVDEARHHWRSQRIALMKCGPLFSVVRIDADVVHAVLGKTKPVEADRVLDAMLYGGPVWMDQSARRYYALMPPSVSLRREWRDGLYSPGAECLGAGSYVGVPDPSWTTPYDGASYWAVPMKGPGDLCDPRAVQDLVERGQYLLRLAKGGSR